jgi:hypothetical protein
MFKKTAFLLLAISLMVGSTSAYAFESSSWKSAGTKGEQARGKLEFGLKNMFLGWTEVIQEPVQAYKGVEGAEGDVFRGLLVGIGNAVLDTAGGIAHFVTFPCTHIDVPLPEGGTDVT